MRNIVNKAMFLLSNDKDVENVNVIRFEHFIENIRPEVRVDDVPTVIIENLDNGNKVTIVGTDTVENVVKGVKEVL
jgi:hypothetical protein